MHLRQGKKKTRHLHREKQTMHLHREKQMMLLYPEEQTMHLHHKMPNDALTSLVRKEWEFVHDRFTLLVGKEF